MAAAWGLVLTSRSTQAPRWTQGGRVRLLFAEPIRSLRAGMSVIRLHRAGVATSIACGGVGWALHLLAFAALAHAVGANIPVALFAVATPLSLVTTWAPISVNGIGLREGVMAGVLVHAGVTPSHAGAASLLVDVQMLPVACAGALLWVLSSRRRRGGVAAAAPLPAVAFSG